jgi:hypothetical protein
VLLRPAYLAVTNVFALLRLIPMSDRDKDRSTSETQPSGRLCTIAGFYGYAV